jgi:1,4-dihydroxy-2-naphthoate octaprenyltransferase
LNADKIEIETIPKRKAWVNAMRLRTLPLALATVGMGSFLAHFYGLFRWDILLLTCLTTLFLQILSNLANDYGDAQHGADSKDREGPGRVVQLGLISKTEMMNAIIIFIMLSLASGLWLLYISLGFSGKTFYFFLVLGVGAILAALGYTLGKKPYGYAGLGDFFVLLFFGIVGVGGSFYLQTGSLHFDIWLPAISCGLLAVGVLNLNNIRDIESDRKAGKKSIPVRLGREKAVWYHWALLFLAFLCCLGFTFMHFRSMWQLVFLIALPLLIVNGRAVKNIKKASLLDPFLKQLALSSLFMILTFGLGLMLS